MQPLHDLFAHYGLALVFLNAFLHEAGAPLPLSPTVILAAGWDASVGGIASIVALVALGSLLGNALWFHAGRRLGAPVLRTLCRVSLSPDTCVAKTSGAFDRWGGALLVVGRFIPGVSLVAPPLAGMTGMPWRRFVALTAVGAAIWALVIALLGVALQSVIASALVRLRGIPAAAWVAPLVVVAGYVAWRIYRRRRTGLLRSVPRVEAVELAAEMRSASPPFVIDVRGPGMRAADGACLAGAASIALEELARLDVEPLAQRRVVLFCGCPNEVSAAAGALALRARGVASVCVLRGGVEALRAAGLAA